MQKNPAIVYHTWRDFGILSLAVFHLFSQSNISTFYVRRFFFRQIMAFIFME